MIFMFFIVDIVCGQRSFASQQLTSNMTKGHRRSLVREALLLNN